jgi:SpoVK/Ycf46/Vps4 family AAA+-type ATPase
MIMANGDQLKALLRSHAEGDDRHFYSVAMQMAAHEAKQGHGKLAEELRELIDAAKARRNAGGGEGAIPIARPKGELAGLLSVSYPSRRLSDMVLSESLEQSLQRVLKEQRHLSKLRSHGLRRGKLLLVSPSGTGKTMTASALAGELGIPLFVVRLDALITKFMGRPQRSCVKSLTPWRPLEASTSSTSSMRLVASVEWQMTWAKSAGS